MTSQQDQMIAIAMPGAEWALEGIFLGGEGRIPTAGLRSPPARCAKLAARSSRLRTRSTAGAWTRPWSRSCALRAGARAMPRCVSTGAAWARAAAPRAAIPRRPTRIMRPRSPISRRPSTGPILAAGYSFGAAAAVRVARANPRVRRLLLVAPPPALLDADALAQFRGSALVVVGSHDSFAPTAELAQLLGDDARRRLEVIPDADHFFMSRARRHQPARARVAGVVGARCKPGPPTRRTRPCACAARAT